MPISFTELTSYAESGQHRRSLRAFGSTHAGVAGVHRRALRALGVPYSGTLATADPEIPTIGVSHRTYRASGEQFQQRYADEGWHMRRFYARGAVGTSGTHRRRFRGYGLPLLSGSGSGMLVTQPMLISGFSGLSFETLDELISSSLTVTSTPVLGMVERFKLKAVPDDSLTGLARVIDRIELGDALLIILRELLAEGLVFGDSAADNYTAIERMVDALAFSGLAASGLEAVSLIAATIAFGDVLQSGDVAALADSVALADTLGNALRAAIALVDELAMSASVFGQVRIGMLLDEGISLAAEPSTMLEAVELLREGATFALHMNIDDGQYMAYVINTESKAVSQYSNYPFNSFARVGGRYFGMTPNGIRELEGPDDAGSPIAARFRMAMSTLGHGQMKRMIAAYLGYTSTGELRLKTITVGVDGVKQANHYRLLEQPASAPREARVKIGQGLRSVYWGFEVEAIDGAAFMIDVLDLQPLVVEQRIQGQGGGKR